MNVLSAESQHHAQALVEEAVAIGKSQRAVGHYLPAFHRQVLQCEIAHAHGVVRAVPLVGRLRLDVRGGEGAERVLPIACAVAQCGVCRQLPPVRRVLHHHVHRPADAVALQISCQALRHLQAVQHLCREDIQWHKAVLVVGRRNLHPVHQGVVVTLVHAAQDGILPLPAIATFQCNARNAAQGIGHGEVRRQFDGLRAHHVHHVHCLALNTACSRLGAPRVVSHHHRFAQFLILFFHRQRQLLPCGVRVQVELPGFVAQVRAAQRAGVPFRVQRERTVESCGRVDVREIFEEDTGTHHLLAGAGIDNPTLDGAGNRFDNGCFGNKKRHFGLQCKHTAT